MTTGIAPRGPTFNRDETAVPGSPSGRHAAHRLVFPLAVAAALVPAGIVAVSAGATRVDWSVTFTVLVSHLLPGFDAGDVSEADAVIVWLIRTPRVIVAALVGGALAASGALMQGLFRNPMAEPNIIGVSAGAVLGAVAAFVTGSLRDRRSCCLWPRSLAGCRRWSWSMLWRRAAAQPRSQPCCSAASRSPRS
jgi:ABC-type Fe3+-siderophore transport system permease subunit